MLFVCWCFYYCLLFVCWCFYYLLLKFLYIIFFVWMAYFCLPNYFSLLKCSLHLVFMCRTLINHFSHEYNSCIWQSWPTKPQHLSYWEPQITRHLLWNLSKPLMLNTPRRVFFFAQTTKGGSNTIIIINKNISISLPIGSSLRRATKCNRCLQGNSVVFTLSGLGLAVCDRASQRSEYIKNPAGRDTINYIHKTD